MPAFEPVTKFNATVDDVARFPDMVRQAFRAATTGTPGPGASAIPRQRRPGRRRGRRDGAAGRAAVRARAAVPAGAGSRRACCAALKVLQDAAAAGDRRRRRRARFGRGSANSSRSPRRCKFRSRPRSTARIRSRAIIRCRSAWSAPIRARAPTASSTPPISSASSAPTTGGMTTHFWAVPKIGTPAIQIDIDPEALGRNYPLQARVNGDAKVTLAKHAGGCRHAAAPASARPGSSEAQSDLQGVVRQIQVGARVRRGADPARAHLPRAVAARAGRRHRRGRHRPRRHVDGRHVRSAHRRRRAICAAPAISAGRSRRGSAPNAARRTGRW